jgi:hypothetical protein
MSKDLNEIKHFKVLKDGEEYQNDPGYEITRVKHFQVTETLRASDILKEKNDLTNEIDSLKSDVAFKEEQLIEVKELITKLGIVEDGKNTD